MSTHPLLLVLGLATSVAACAKAPYAVDDTEPTRDEAEPARDEPRADPRQREPTRDEARDDPQQLEPAHGAALAEPRSQRASMSDDEVREAIIERESSAWDGPCRCPDDTMSNGRRCGGNSAYSRQGGAGPACYPGEVTQEMVDAYRDGTGPDDP